MSDRFAQVMAQQRPGYALSRPFYCDAAFFEREAERILLRHWHCAGHQSQLPEPGDFFTLDICGESLIIVRGHDRQVHALLNVCRHRGSRVCTERTGHARGGVFVCPYHAWTYTLDGSLRAARHMPPDFERTSHGLRAAHARVIEGLIFVSLAQTPLGLEHVEEMLAGCARVYGWATAKVAHRETYPVNANWKLAVENYMECYHCGPAHEEYSRFHLYARPAALNREADERVRARARTLGVTISEVDHWGLAALPGQEAADSTRSALAEGAVSGSEDGRALGPLMGEFNDYDGGVTFFDVGLTSNFLAYPDHGLIYRFVPRSVGSTDMEVIWLVRADAREGTDYDLARLTWLWKVTSIADKRIIELNQQGITSRYYEPGPYSEMELHTRRLVEWILAELR
ncbi:MAG TPA: aromatic ring-hydroxylating dioxygenase subunit alpha [Steroidobacteraceae bacterium]|jgi:phenylpropionate dioxygenase-like ring-hydroxylating dioxygenase large terminal subunit|nr:aromatic ring-hydroxylating dioxygenase subunit alpha [Steroidobacteraceae bacterium]